MWEMDECNEQPREGRKFFQFLATFIVSLIVIQSGINLGWSSPVLPYLSSNSSFLPQISETQLSWVTSLMPLGAVVGAAPVGKIADTIGRKFTITITSIPFLVSWIILTFFSETWKIHGIYIARFIGGLGSGATGVLVPVYIGEIAEPEIRGALGSFFPFFLALGIVFAYIFGSIFNYVTFNVCCCLAILPFLVSVFFLPESPMWLVHQERKNEARRSLRKLRGSEYDVENEIESLVYEGKSLKLKEGGLYGLSKTNYGRRSIITCVGLMWFQQMCGIDAVLFYTVTTFQDAGSTIEPFLSTVIIGMIQVVMAIFVGLIIDKFGRKPLLIVSGFAMCVCLGILGYYFKLKHDGNDVSLIGWAPLLSLSLFNVVFSVGYGTVPYSIIAEIFPPETKGIASSISIMTNWFLVFAVTKFFPIMVITFGRATIFWTFSVMCGASGVFGFFVPETKGKTLQEIQEKLARTGKNKKDCIDITIS